MSNSDWCPKGWKAVTLGDLGEVNRGRSRHRPRYAEHLYGGKYPFIQTGDIKSSNGKIINYEQTYSEAGLAQSRLWPADTMCITIAANIAETAILTFPACFPDSVVGFIPDNSKCDVRFVEYMFRYLKRRIQHEATGSVQDNINLGTLSRLYFPIPPLPEQKAIASILSSLDDKIELNQKMNQTLEEIARAIFKSWFVDFDPVRAKMEGKQPVGMDTATANLFPDSFEESALGLIPRGWEVKLIKDICHVSRGASPRPIREYLEGDIPWIKIADATASNGLFIFETKETIKRSGVSKSVPVIPGDLILSNSATCGVPIFVEIEGCIHDGWLLFRSFSKISKGYLYHYLKFISDKLVQIADGSVQKNLNTKLVGEQLIIISSKNIIDAFDKINNSIFNKIRSNSIESRTLTNIRDTLLPKLMSGEIRVKEAERMIEEVV
jgi:type I restriction enzyme S subunit